MGFDFIYERRSRWAAESGNLGPPILQGVV